MRSEQRFHEEDQPAHDDNEQQGNALPRLNTPTCCLIMVVLGSPGGAVWVGEAGG